MSKVAVVVLTRGYTNIHQYDSLIKRNISIAKNIGVGVPPIDIVIFHEGNITPEHQQYIAKFTPSLKLIFTCIKEHAFKEEKKEIQMYEPTRKFGLNYRHMCSFWFVDFWNYVQDYDMILRVDEDCIINFQIPELFYMLHDKAAVYGSWIKDHSFVTRGLNQFTQQFIRNTIPNVTGPVLQHNPSGPYTNVIGFNLTMLRENTLLQKYIQQVAASNNIYIFRWGDLPLWGEAFFYFCKPTTYIKSDRIKYFHGSHNTYVGDVPPIVQRFRRMMI